MLKAIKNEQKDKSKYKNKTIILTKDRRHDVSYNLFKRYSPYRGEDMSYGVPFWTSVVPQGKGCI